MSGKQQTVLITGGTDGLEKAAALLLAERGYRVYAAGRSAPKRQELDRLAAEKKVQLESVELDVCDDASVQRAVQSVFGTTMGRSTSMIQLLASVSWPLWKICGRAARNSLRRIYSVFCA